MAHSKGEPPQVQSTRCTRVAAPFENGDVAALYCSSQRVAEGAAARGAQGLRPSGVGTEPRSRAQRIARRHAGIARYALGVAVAAAGLCAAEAAGVIGHPIAAFVTGPVLAGLPRTHSAASRQEGVWVTPFAHPTPFHARGLPMRESRVKHLPLVGAKARRPRTVAMKAIPPQEMEGERNLGERLVAGYTAGLVARPLQTKMLTNFVSAIAADMIKQASRPALEATQGQNDSFVSQLPYTCYLEEVASVGD